MSYLVTGFRVLPQNPVHNDYLLKTKELSLLFPILAIATTGPALEGMSELLRRLGDARARLLILSDVADFDGLGDTDVGVAEASVLE